MIKNRTTCFLVVAIFLVLCDFSTSVDVEYITPSRGGFKGGQVVEIFGTGFREFSSVACLFNDKWAGFSGVIVKDTVVQCEVPVIDASEFQSIPFRATVDLIFDGTTIVPVTDNFVVGPAIKSISPTSGFVNGGNTVTLTGYYFTDFDAFSVQFDGSDCHVTGVTDTEIYCTVPPGQFNQNAIIQIVFNGNREFYIEATQTYHYGPLLTTVVPSCGSLVGGTLVTITGLNMNDPAINNAAYPANLNPSVQISFTESNADDDDYTVGDFRYFGINPVYDGTKVVFQTPNVEEDVFGKQVRLFVFFKENNAKVLATPKDAFRYGPIVYNSMHTSPSQTVPMNPSPSSGHVGGGDSITISGCGFSQFPTALISPYLMIDGVKTPLCDRGLGAGTPSDTLKVSSCTDQTKCLEQITCRTAKLACTTNSESLDVPFYVQFTPLNGTAYTHGPYFEPSADQATLYFTVGPQVQAISKASGIYNGGDSLSITGKNFFYSASSSANWTPTVRFVGEDSVFSTTGTVKSDTEITVTTPSGLFDYDTEVFVDFKLNNNATTCSSLPRGNVIDYHYGPFCSSVSPINGHLSGGSLVTLTGTNLLTGFSANVISVRICLDRLNNYDGSCEVYELPERDTTFKITDTQITFTTPSIRNGITTNVGGNKLFGDVAGIYIYYGGVGSNFLDNQTQSLVYCGDYTFGPIVTKNFPTKGPYGPAGENSPNTPVTITGSGFADPIFDSEVQVALGPSITLSSKITSDSSITAGSNFGAYSNYDDYIDTIFNPCNLTMTGTTQHWGPVVVDFTYFVGASDNSEDAWGAQGGQDIEIILTGIDNSLLYIDTYSYPIDEDYYIYYDVYALLAEVYVGGVEAIRLPITVPYYFDNDVYAIDFSLPDLSFGTDAEIEIVFYEECDGIFPLRMVGSIVLSQKVHYYPKIQTFSPDYGLTSGGTLVTFSGLGFNGWDDWQCYFGNYPSPATYFGEDGFISCIVPYHRGEFNTDVTVSIVFDDKEDQKIWADTKYHYGPLCFDITPNNGYIAGGYTATILGDGFIDCTVSYDYDYAPFSNCTFVEINVLFSVASSNTSVEAPITYTNDTETVDTETGYVTYTIKDYMITDNEIVITIPQGSCMYNPNVTLYFPDVEIVTLDAQRYVPCTNSDRSFFFHYGPLFESQSSEFYRSGISYGWENDEVTITGLNFLDPDLGASSCNFDNVTGTASTLDDNTIICTVPAGSFDLLTNVSIAWGNCESEMEAEKFHYGPVLDSIYPPRGYVLERTNVTIFGFAFECCGITDYEVLWPEGAKADGLNETIYDSELPDQVVAPVPANTNIDAQIRNIGVRFNSTLFSSTVGSGSLDYLTHTEAGGDLRFYYGPYVYAIVPEISSLSGRGDVITISGWGFEDPYFIATFCDFTSTTGHFNDTAGTLPVDDFTIVCPVKTYNHYCGDVDTLRPVWERTGTTFRKELGHRYYKTEEPGNLPVPLPNQLPYWVDDGSTVPTYAGEVKYGPVSTGATASFIFDGMSVTQIYGESSFFDPIRIYFDDLSDFVSDSEHDVGNELALCKFGDRYSVFFSTVEFDEEEGWYVDCDVPPVGKLGFGMEGEIAVLFNPQIFTLYTSTYHWNWLPYVDEISRRVGQTGGREVLLLEGNGFCDYESVYCNFGDNQSLQSAIVTDSAVMCETPANNPGVYEISLVFCDNDGCTSSSTPDVVAAPSFTYAGVTGINPSEGSLCGGLTITVSGFGFSFYDRLSCAFGDQAEVEATLVSDNAVTCVVPDLSPLHVNTDLFAQCIDVIVIGKYGGNINLPMLSPVNFEFGSPYPIVAIPAEADVSSSTEIVINGNYFQGADPRGSYFCQFGDLNPVPGTLYIYQEGGKEIYSIICYTPTLTSTPSLTVGEYDLEIIFPCQVPSKTASRIPFRFTQNPRILSFSPSSGTEIGGTQVEVKGRDLGGGSKYFCSFGTMGIDNQVVSAEYDPTADAVYCNSPALVVDFDTKVDFYITLDGGETWSLADAPYEYVNAVIVCDQPFAPYYVEDNSSLLLQPTLLLLLSAILFFA